MSYAGFDISSALLNFSTSDISFVFNRTGNEQVSSIYLQIVDDYIGGSIGTIYTLGNEDHYNLNVADYSLNFNLASTDSSLWINEIQPNGRYFRIVTSYGDGSPDYGSPWILLTPSTNTYPSSNPSPITVSQYGQPTDTTVSLSVSASLSGVLSAFLDNGGFSYSPLTSDASAYTTGTTSTVTVSELIAGTSYPIIMRLYVTGGLYLYSNPITITTIGSSGGGGGTPTINAPTLTSVTNVGANVEVVYSSEYVLDSTWEISILPYPYSEASAGSVYISNVSQIVSQGNNSYKVTFSTNRSDGASVAIQIGYNGVQSSMSNAVTVTTQSGDGGGGGGAAAPCFFGNARVLTPAGYCRMDSLRTGDLVMTHSGKKVVIEAVKVTLVPAGPATNPYVIEAGQFGCERRLLISPEHKVAVAGRGMVKAKDLGLVQEEREGDLTYYNLRLAGEEAMVVQGVPVESLAHVDRIVMTRGAFERAVAAKYGKMTPAIRAMIARTCRFLEGDRVECPIMRR